MLSTFSLWQGPFARAGYTLALALSLIFITLISPNNIVYAGGPIDGSTDIYCIQASVISHDERPFGTGWTITATSVTGRFTSQTQTTNGAGTARFDLPADRWEFALTLPDDYMPITPDKFTITIEPTFTGCQDVRFKIKQIIPVTVVKLNQNHVPEAGWIIRADPGPGYPLAKAMPIEALTDATGQALFKLTAGDWVFSERAPAATVFTPITPLSGEIGVNISGPGPHTIYFKNNIHPRGCIEVTKQALSAPDVEGAQDFPLAQWGIDVKRADGSLVASKLTDINGYVRFDGLPLGPYTVEEESRIGWRPTGSPAVKVAVVKDAREGCERIEFRNEQDHSYCIEGRKIDQNGSVGLPNWIIKAYPLDAGGYEPVPATTDGLGKYRIELPQNDYRIPGAKYRVCEESQAGWEPVSETCYIVEIWDQAGMCETVPDFVNKQSNRATVPLPAVQRTAHKASSNQPANNRASGLCSRYHTVAKGEALFAIGAKYGRSSQAMLNANPSVRSQRHWYVYVGQKLCIP